MSESSDPPSDPPIMTPQLATAIELLRTARRELAELIAEEVAAEPIDLGAER